ncbi:MAG: clan AA aspartic protease [Alphaproteobacteria bacterium]|nr:clan AA aspartic protease [Alphaproteobacteria bacterium]
MKYGATCGLLLLLATCALAQAEEQKDCRLTRFSEIPITTLPDGRFTVPIKLNGQNLDFLVDTGGAVAEVQAKQAFNLELNVQQASGYIKGVAGTKVSSFATITRVSLGGMEGYKLDAFVNPNLSAGAEGILAPDILKHFDVDLDFVHGKLNLISPKHCKGKVVYWTSGYVALPMEVVDDGHIQVPVTVNGVKLRAILDTGARMTIMSMRAAKQLGITEKSIDLKSANEKEEKYKLYNYPFKQLDFDGVTVNNPYILVASDGFLPARDTDILIGISTLRQLHLYIAYGEEKLYVTPATAN